jgi:hypothetical protein
MLSHFARWTLAFALALAAHASIPGWTPAAMAAPAPTKKCTVKSHQHGKVAAAKPAKAVGGGAGAQMRRSPDIQILSFGP